MICMFILHVDYPDDTDEIKDWLGVLPKTSALVWGQ